MHDDDRRIALSVQTMVQECPLRIPCVEGADAVRLSRFAFIRGTAEGTLVESPLSTRRIYLVTAQARFLAAACGAATTVAALSGELGRPVGETARLVGWLLGAGLADRAVDGEFADDADELRQWEFHDLLFHSRSRSGRHDYPFGGLFPYRGELSPAPAIRPSHRGSETVLPRPDLARVLAEDSPFTTVLEGRTSTRHYGGPPPTVDRIAEFLYRVARVRTMSDPDAIPYPTSSRPYPTGGAGYDLEIYLTVHRCEGLAQGSYHYDPVEHRLVELATDPADHAKLLAWSVRSARLRAQPDILITLTSRFQRLSWKYRSIAYAATLKNVGVLYQTMYLVATAMGLGACALGAGDADLATRAFRLNHLEESSVGEFLVGSLPEEGRVARNLPVAVNDPGWHDHAVERLRKR